MSILGAMYAAVSGLSANSNALGIISDNIANSDTVGYKETSTNFATLVTESGSPNLYSPGGVQSSPSYNISAQGIIQAASSPTDLAISGNGFFVVNNVATGTAGGGTTSFTRAGNFSIDANGDLENSSGFFLQGQKLTAAQAAAIQTGNTAQLTVTSLSSLQTVNVSGISGTARPTANVSLVANLPADEPPGSPPETMTVPVFDSQGVEHDMTLSFAKAAATPSTEDFTLGGAAPQNSDTFTISIDGQTFTTEPMAATTPTINDIATAIGSALDGTSFTASVVNGQIQIADTSGNPLTNVSITPNGTAGETFTAGATTNGAPAPPNQWIVSATIAGAGNTTVTIAPGDNIVQFNADGTLNGPGSTFAAPNALSINWDPTVSGGTSPQTLTMNLGADGTDTGLSQLGTGFSVGNVTQDGVEFGNFTGVTISQNGIVTANFSNGLQQAIYIVPVATFPDPDGLQPQSGNVYAQTTASGTALLNQAGTGAAGSIAPSSLENSTVDIATEFSNLIVTQRAYEANSKVITTADQMLQDLLAIIQ
jgi:flagellar hook protein FlgE